MSVKRKDRPATEAPVEAAARRQPIQDRGQRRVDAILAAAAAVFEEVGYEAATTSAIAARARAPIGSLYQFFPNKQAVLFALAERYSEQSLGLYDSFASSDAVLLPLDQLLETMLDAFARFYSTLPGFRALMSALATSAELQAGEAQLHSEFVRRTAEIIHRRSPHLTANKRRLLAEVVIQTVDALTYLAARADPTFSQAIFSETKALLYRYLAPYDAGTIGALEVAPSTAPRRPKGPKSRP
jgi:AcrR family transcriptional regulator